MLYHGFWIDCIQFREDADGTFHALFVIRRRHSLEIVAEALSVDQALETIRDIEREHAAQGVLNLKVSA